MRLFTHALTVPFSGHPVHYTVSIDEYGQVKEMKCPIFELVPSAQKLSLGGKADEFIPKIKGYQGLFPFLLTFAFAGWLKPPNPSVKELVDKVESWLNSKGSTWWDLPQTGISDDWVGFIRQENLQHAPKPGTTIEGLLANMVDWLEQEPFEPERSPGYLNHFIIPKGNEFIWAILPFLTSHQKKGVYEAVKNYPHEANLQRLLGALTTETDEDCLIGIFLGMEVYQDEQIADALVGLYRYGNLTDGEGMGKLLEVLGKYPGEEREAILWEKLEEGVRYTGGYAIKALQQHGVSEERLMESVRPLLYGDDLSKIEASIDLLHVFKNTSLLPDGDELLRIFTQSETQKPNLNCTYSMPSLLIKRQPEDLARKLFELTMGDNENLQKAILIINSCLLRDSKIDYVSDPDFLARCLHLARYGGGQVQEEAIRTMGNIGNLEKSTSVLDDLHRFYLEAEEERTRLTILDAMANVLDVLPASGEIKTLFLSLLSNDNARIRKTGVYGLMKTNEPEVRKSLLGLADDEDADIRKHIKRLDDDFRDKELKAAEAKVDAILAKRGGEVDQDTRRILIQAALTLGI